MTTVISTFVDTSFVPNKSLASMNARMRDTIHKASLSRAMRCNTKAAKGRITLKRFD